MVKTKRSEKAGKAAKAAKTGSAGAKRKAKGTMDSHGQEKPSSRSRDLRNRSEQIGAILTKSLDLAEAGISLGVNLVSKLGSVVQGQVIQTHASGISSGGPAYPAHGDHSGRQAGGGSDAEKGGQAGQDASVGVYIVNRLPLSPGSQVYIPFSINNDSPASAKSLVLNVEGFVGQVRNFNLDPRGFALSPSEKTIGPMDFEKFVFTGEITQDAPEDTYYGWVAVSGDQQFRIPVVLVVSGGE